GGIKRITRPSSPSGSSPPDTTVPSTEILIAPIPPAPSTEIATISPSCDISIHVIIASPAVHSRIRRPSRKSTLVLRPVMTLARSVALRRARRAALSLETSLSDTSFGFMPDSLGLNFKFGILI
nr:hypothetical protein [Tanacetum cinerariifolium]